jgi:hypothetical protein
MSEREDSGQGAAETQSQTNSQAGDEQRAVAEGESVSYRKAEEDSTLLAEEQRTGEGTGAKAGEYS